jgi:hypothetical protein
MVESLQERFHAISFVDIGDFARIEMETGPKVGHRHLGEMPSNTFFGHGKDTRESRDTVHVEMNPSRGRH